MTSAVCAGDAQVAAECFTSDGVYHDGFYGEFAGREAIASMITGLFHRDASDFVWQVSDACCDGRMGYARYHFAYVSKIPGSEGRRVGFAGVSCCVLDGGRIRRYSELFERAPVLVQLGFGNERILKSIKRWAK
jgi:SnoaL-like domain